MLHLGKKRPLSFVFITLLLLTACGQKSALTLPDDPQKNTPESAEEKKPDQQGEI